MEALALAVKNLIENVEQVILGKRPQIELIAIALLCGGHVLIDDVPGTGKTMLARAFARSLGVEFRRLQCTPDLLPSDVTGIRVFDPRSAEFRFEPGPVFSNVVLADEINRATPRTQAALLEAMAERQVTVDGTTYDLSLPFMVLATQNPVEFEGTFPLPEAQLDRFLLTVTMGYPTPMEEQSLIRLIKSSHPIDRLGAVVDGSHWPSLMTETADLHMDESVESYIVELVNATRTHTGIALGASPRATIALASASRAKAAIAGRDYVLPDDVKALAGSVLAHRLILAPESRLRGMKPAAVIEEILERVGVSS